MGPFVRGQRLIEGGDDHDDHDDGSSSGVVEDVGLALGSDGERGVGAEVGGEYGRAAADSSL